MSGLFYPKGTLAHDQVLFAIRCRQLLRAVRRSLGIRR